MRQKVMAIDEMVDLQLGRDGQQPIYKEDVAINETNEEIRRQRQHKDGGDNRSVRDGNSLEEVEVALQQRWHCNKGDKGCKYVEYMKIAW